VQFKKFYIVASDEGGWSTPAAEVLLLAGAYDKIDIDKMRATDGFVSTKSVKDYDPKTPDTALTDNLGAGFDSYKKGTLNRKYTVSKVRVAQTSWEPSIILGRVILRILNLLSCVLVSCSVS